MNQTSSIATAGMTVSAATLVPVVNWALNGFPHPIPETVPYLIAAALITGSHLIYNLIQEKAANKATSIEPQPNEKAAS